MDFLPAHSQLKLINKTSYGLHSWVWVYLSVSFTPGQQLVNFSLFSLKGHKGQKSFFSFTFLVFHDDYSAQKK